MTKVPCKDCIHCDIQKKFTPKGPKDAWYAWCAAKSIYPKVAPDGMNIPDGAKRAEGDRCTPVIIDPTKIVATCTSVIRKIV